MTHRRTWQKFEQRIAEKLGGKRNPLSGADPKTGTKADGQIPDLFLECKLRSKVPFYADFRKAQALAEAEGKPLAFVIHSKGTKQDLAVVDFRFFQRLVNESRAFRKDMGSAVRGGA